ncbi:MAG: hypothetical protein F4X98_17845 [Gammaproteobacteria bacterium]|nr:hypothetical protein [Gammaproteobacteria bacterium]
MAEAATAAKSDRDHLWNEVCDLGLQTYIADLDANGYTVVPPELASPNGLAERMLEACLDVAERRSGERPDLATGSTDPDSPVGGAMDTMLLEHPVFEESLMNPVMLALVTHLCDYNVVLSSMSCSIKGPSDVQFHLHTDTRLPSPLPAQALVCKCIYLLTDFNRDKGSTVFVPGSHKWCRNPEGSETSIDNDHAVPIDAPAGSLVVFQGNVWHGAHNRVAPGLRVSLHLLMVRPIIRTREDFIGRIPQAVLDRNPARFAILAQQALVPGSIEPGDLKLNVQRTQKYISAFEEESGVRLPAKHR